VAITAEEARRRPSGGERLAGLLVRGTDSAAAAKGRRD